MGRPKKRPLPAEEASPGGAAAAATAGAGTGAGADAPTDGMEAGGSARTEPAANATTTAWAKGRIGMASPDAAQG